MELTQDKIDLISEIIRSDRKFANNEDLFEDFLNETCRRAVTIFEAINNPSTLKVYLKKVVTTSIINVLKDSGRLRRSKSGYMSTKEVTVEPMTFSSPNENSDENNCVNSRKVSQSSVSYANIKIPPTPEENAIRNEILDFVARTLTRIDKLEPNKNYMKIFIQRYQNGMTQKQISHELGISQSEVSKRIYGLIDKVKNVLDE